ncbi:PREDICTED: uncharacterized protein LOC104593426 [Nelumbo nucifera]|uniref:Uncharacterized protein LOC104593426 n=2 Tax=Nelumbo nucifera TaxID=4432 RepID=A0A1U7ZJ12_NELNU|nr:PREDICTED: uncharacterized protein LOC104593426 [Nelumbo nucifera]DAD43273.1 TPA_asm: hypothetical protein HUJ06_001503 [Nelumbo nucifera]
MGSKRRWYFIWVICCLCLFISSSGQALNNLTHDDLDDLFQDYAFKAFKALVRPRTGKLYNAALPVNLSGMEASVVRLRRGSFWVRGANFSTFHIPPRIIPLPYVKRLAIVYQNLGNWSSYYYRVPGYALVAPVVGFMVYDASNLSATSITKLSLSLRGDPISIRFPQVVLPEGSNSTIRCATFSEDGSVLLSEMTLPSECLGHDQGHFSLVVSVPPIAVPLKRKVKLWKWWAIGFGSGFIGLVLVGLVGIVALTFVKKNKFGEMERRASEGEAFDTVWIGTSKMPSARVIRTQPVLENGDAP